MYRLKIFKPCFLKQNIAITVSLFLPFSFLAYAGQNTIPGQQQKNEEWSSVDLADSQYVLSASLTQAGAQSAANQSAWSLGTALGLPDMPGRAQASPSRGGSNDLTGFTGESRAITVVEHTTYLLANGIELTAEEGSTFTLLPGDVLDVESLNGRFSVTMVADSEITGLNGVSIKAKNKSVTFELNGNEADLSTLRGKAVITLDGGIEKVLDNGVTVSNTGQESAKIDISNGRLDRYVSGTLKITTTDRTRDMTIKFDAESGFGNNSSVKVTKGGGAFTIDGQTQQLDFRGSGLGKFVVNLKGKGSASPTIITENGEISLLHKKVDKSDSDRWQGRMKIDSGSLTTVAGGNLSLKITSDNSGPIKFKDGAKTLYIAKDTVIKTSEGNFDGIEHVTDTETTQIKFQIRLSGTYTYKTEDLEVTYLPGTMLSFTGKGLPTMLRNENGKPGTAIFQALQDNVVINKNLLAPTSKTMKLQKGEKAVFINNKFDKTKTTELRTGIGFIPSMSNAINAVVGAIGIGGFDGGSGNAAIGIGGFDGGSIGNAAIGLTSGGHSSGSFDGSGFSLSGFAGDVIGAAIGAAIGASIGGFFGFAVGNIIGNIVGDIIGWGIGFIGSLF